jgi:hypothetical protein
MTNLAPGGLLLMLAATLKDPEERALAEAGMPSRLYRVAQSIESLVAVLADKTLAERQRDAARH